MTVDEGINCIENWKVLPKNTWQMTEYNQITVKIWFAIFGKTQPETKNGDEKSSKKKLKMIRVQMDYLVVFIRHAYDHTWNPFSWEPKPISNHKKQ